MLRDLLGASPPRPPGPSSADIQRWAASRPEGEDAGDALADAARCGLLSLPLPGHGHTWERWSALAAAGAHDLAFARLAEGHADALAILAEAGVRPPAAGSTLGVWAAGPPDAVRAFPEGEHFRLAGKRRWCSGASTLTHAIVTAELAGERQLFLVDLSDAGFHPEPGTWPAVGMAGSDTLDATFKDVTVGRHDRVGGAGFYVERAGFWQGSAGVAACWFGGAQGLLRAFDPVAKAGNPHAMAHLGAIASRLWSMEACLWQAAASIDADPDDAAGHGHAIALAVRHVIETGVSEILDRIGRATGAEPLGHSHRHAQMVADLLVYVRQIHAEADLAELGRLVAPLMTADTP